MSKLSHVGEDGRARMVDVTEKTPNARTASAQGVLICRSETLDSVKSGTAPKGSVIQTAELAGVMGAKRTADLIPLCHPLPLTKIVVTIEMDEKLPGFRIASEVRTVGATGVEMEALTAVSIAGLTLFDMLKAIDRTMEIGEVRVTAKEGGKSGSWERE
ncbi:MAG TPA: cyclic pyranopterin monophosphate synthase MoaC [Allosphingosinicella sp.]|nr:cyclic pyranopterin monophosphate synthase MoaC [Allosphingosinicella sp.]